MRNNSINRKDLVAEYLLNGDATDTGGSNDGTATDVTRDTATRGYVKEVGSFNGTSSYIDTNYTLNETDFSLSGRFNTTQTTEGTIMCAMGSGNNQFRARINTNKIEVYIKDNSGNSDTLTWSTAINDGLWHNWIFTKKGAGEILLYIDNKEVDIGSGISDKLDLSSKHSFVLGQRRDGSLTGRFFDGRMGLVRIYDTVLTQNEIQALYIEGLRRLGDKPNYPKLFEGCVAYYDMDGDAQDIIGDNNGTVSGAVLTTDHLGMSNHAYSFDGADDYIDTTTTITNVFSISMRVNFNAIDSTSDTVFTTINSTDRDGCLLHRYYNSNKMQFNGYSGNSYLGSVATNKDDYVANTRYHITTTYNEGTTNIYINGVLDVNGSITDFETNDEPVGFGRYYQNTTQNLLDGDMANVKIYNRALSSDEISELYNLESKKYIYPRSNGSLPWLEEGLVADYPMITSGTDVPDISGNGRTGTSANTPVKGRIGQHNYMSFDGSSDRIRLADLGIGNGNFTFSARFKIPVDDDARHQILAIHDSGAFSNKCELYVGSNSENDSIAFVFRDGTSGGTTKIGTINVKDNIYHNVVLTRSGQVVNTYLDGRLFTTQTDAENIATLGPSYDIGAFYTGTFYNGFTGNISDTKFYNRVLSAKEIEQLYYLTNIHND